MRKRLATVLATALMGGVIAVGGATPAQACHEIGDDPVYNWVCGSVHNAPGVKETVAYYANVVTSTVHWAYCEVSPHC